MAQPIGISEILRGGGELIFVGALVLACCTAGWLWVRSARKTLRNQALQHHPRYVEQQEMFDRQLTVAKSRYEKQVQKLERESAIARRDVRALETDNGRLHRKSKFMRRQAALRQRDLSALQKHLADLQSWDGRLWERPLTGESPAFVDATQRRSRMIAVVNLKGGVGKTTLTANLGVTLARRGRCVLMVDLDFQYSLTGLCTSNEQRLMLRQKKLTTSRLLDVEGGPTPDTVREVLVPVRGLEKGIVCDLIPAEDELAEAEQRAQARWLVQSMRPSAGASPNGKNAVAVTPDARFLFRQAFHASPLLDRYDYILFDCPPRLTTACVNALACCDFVLMPVLLDQLSVDALPRTLSYLGRLSAVSRARLLGIVGNRARFHGENLIARQKNSYDGIARAIPQLGVRALPFRATVRNSANVEEAANAGSVAAATDAGMAFFKDLADAVEQGVRDALPDPVTSGAR